MNKCAELDSSVVRYSRRRHCAEIGHSRQYIYLIILHHCSLGDSNSSIASHFNSFHFNGRISAFHPCPNMAFSEVIKVQSDDSLPKDALHHHYRSHFRSVNANEFESVCVWIFSSTFFF